MRYYSSKWSAWPPTPRSSSATRFMRPAARNNERALFVSELPAFASPSAVMRLARPSTDIAELLVFCQDAKIRWRMSSAWVAARKPPKLRAIACTDSFSALRLSSKTWRSGSCSSWLYASCIPRNSEASPFDAISKTAPARPAFKFVTLDKDIEVAVDIVILPRGMTPHDQCTFEFQHEPSAPQTCRSRNRS